MTVTSRPPSPVTELLAAVGRGETAAHERLWAAIYDELRRVAHIQMAHDSPGRTLQPTALVHEAYFRLVGDGNVQWANRRHFFAAAAKAMRQIRIDDARKRNRLKRGGGRRPTPLDDNQAIFDQVPTEVLAVDEALSQLEHTNPRQAEVVMLRYFAGLTREEIADALDLSPRTIDNDWRFARAWLHRELSGE
ncbi:MAG: sigma-70 family RNA polymerase sigma factor [Phycisphaerae bacterium]|nr:sigma-70 family RNA polymerase sigma factor [Phycisphaerae bacterium]